MLPHTTAFARALALGAFVATAASSAHASITVYTSEASFLAALSLSGTDRFEDLGVDVIDSPINRAVGGFGYRASVDEGFYRVGNAGDFWLSTNVTNPIAFDNFTGGAQAVGGYFFTTDFDGLPLSGESMTITFTDSTTSIQRSLLNTTPTTFLGFVSSTFVTGLQVGVVDSGRDAWATVNNLSLGRAIAAPVPEPTSALLMAAGLAAVGTLVRRRPARRR